MGQKTSESNGVGAEDIERVGLAGSIMGLDVSPDGRHIAFGSLKGDTVQIYVLPIEGGDPVRLTEGKERSAFPRWSPTGNLIAFSRDIGGDENWGIYVVRPDGGEVEDVSRCPGKLTEQHSWSPDGSRITYVSNRDGQFEVYYSDIAGGTAHRVTNFPSVHHSPRFSPDGTHIAFASNRTRFRNNWDTFVINLENGQERKITEHQGEADEMSYYAFQPPVWSPDGRRVLIGSSVPGNYDLMAIDVETLEREWIASSRWDEFNGQWSPDGTHLAYVVNEDANVTIHVKNLADGRTWPVSPSEGVAGLISLRSTPLDYRWTPDGKYIVYAYAGPQESGSIWVVAAEGGAPTLLYSTMPDGYDLSSLVKPEIVHYPSFDGRQISAVYYRPAGVDGPVPTIIHPHGGPTYQSMNTWNPQAQFLVSRGYAVFEPNFRGSMGYGTEFQWLNRNDWGGGDLEDVVAGADWLEKQALADRFGITGGSYGGFMTMSAITRYPERWQAAVALVAPVDLGTFYETARQDMKQFQARNIGTPEENPDFYYQRSPINFVERIQCPLLVLHGERDPRVHIGQVNGLRDRLQASGKQFEIKVYEHEGHGLMQPENRIDALRRTVQFFDRHLARSEVRS